MILSHKHRFIFLKTAKTAGTSFEIALSAFCGPHDIITPLKNSEERLRNELGFRGAQNHRKGILSIAAQRKRVDLERIKAFRWPEAFRVHATADEVRRGVVAEVWNKYHKLTIVRNPFDQIVSQYYHKKYNQVEFPDFEEWLVNNIELLLKNQNIYWIGDDFVANHVIRYEHLVQDIARLETEIPGLRGLGDIFVNINAKGHYRPRQGATVADFFGGNNDLRGLVRCLCRRDCERFGYDYPV